MALARLPTSSAISVVAAYYLLQKTNSIPSQSFDRSSCNNKGSLPLGASA
jgi:hypothetical protein